jgi:maleylpyruvate isomerase
MKLYTYFRSSAAYRVRIALNLKGLDVEQVPVHLIKGGGQQLSEEYRSVNPAALVPALVLDDGTALAQSVAIIEYLDEVYPQPALMPADALGRARVRALTLGIACDLHPLANLRVLRYLMGTVGATEEVKEEWYRHWVVTGLDALEAQLARSPDTGRFCHGDTPTMADVLLVPQAFNAVRAKLDLATWPTIARINEACLAMEAFAAAHPSRQPDAE